MTMFHQKASVETIKIILTHMIKFILAHSKNTYWALTLAVGNDNAVTILNVTKGEYMSVDIGGVRQTLTY